MKCFGRLCVAMLLGLAAPALAQTWQVDAASSTLTFTNTYQNVEYTGQFHRFDATIVYDPNDLAHAKFDVSVDVASLDTQNSERDHTALGADFFATAKFPKAHFVTTAFRKAADGKVIADGVLTLRGISRPVALTVAFAPRGDSATLDVTAPLKRLDFGIGMGQWADPSMIGNSVTVRGHLLLRKANP
ncbi:MAG TPA: YceI family protein [Rhodanobacteraceae bacterium]|nr:YceI family protein [Rhodanobacteraceae bacterium]